MSSPSELAIEYLKKKGFEVDDANEAIRNASSEIVQMIAEFVNGKGNSDLIEDIVQSLNPKAEIFLDPNTAKDKHSNTAKDKHFNRGVCKIAAFNANYHEKEAGLKDFIEANKQKGLNAKYHEKEARLNEFIDPISSDNESATQDVINNEEEEKTKGKKKLRADLSRINDRLRLYRTAKEKSDKILKNHKLKDILPAVCALKSENPSKKLKCNAIAGSELQSNVLGLQAISDTNPLNASSRPLMIECNKPPSLERLTLYPDLPVKSSRSFHPNFPKPIKIIPQNKRKKIKLKIFNIDRLQIAESESETESEYCHTEYEHDLESIFSEESNLMRENALGVKVINKNLLIKNAHLTEEKADGQDIQPQGRYEESKELNTEKDFNLSESSIEAVEISLSSSMRSLVMKEGAFLDSIHEIPVELKESSESKNLDLRPESGIFELGYTKSMSILKVGQFDCQEMFKSHKFIIREGLSKESILELTKHLKELENSALSENFICVYLNADNCSQAKIAAISLDDSPFAYGVYLFDASFPSEYPKLHPFIKFAPFPSSNPKLPYRLHSVLEDGKLISPSLQNNWHESSTLIDLTSEIFSSAFQLPATITQITITSHEIFSLSPRDLWMFLEMLYINYRFGIIEMIRNIPIGLEMLVYTHFSLLRKEVLTRLADWIKVIQTLDISVDSGYDSPNIEIIRELQKRGPLAAFIELKSELEKTFSAEF